MNLDPAAARKRPDLSFLTVRSARAAEPPPSPPTPPVVQPVETAPSSLDLAPPTVAPPASQAPSFSGSLDLDDAPAAPPPSATATPPPPTSSVSGSLDLDDTPAAAAVNAPEVRNPVGHIGGPLPGSSKPAQDRPLWHRPQLPLGGRLVLTNDVPAVTISRLAAGIGILTIDAAVSAAGGEVLLTCAYELEPEVAGATPITSLLSRDGRYRSAAPPDHRRPVLMSGKSQFDRIAIDLRQVRSIRRLLVMLVAVQGTPIDWAGTLILTTHGGGRVEVPIDHMANSLVGAAVALYQVDGELVARSELESAQSVREASQAFGYDGITWVDDRTPLG